MRRFLLLFPILMLVLSGLELALPARADEDPSNCGIPCFAMVPATSLRVRSEPLKHCRCKTKTVPTAFTGERVNTGSGRATYRREPNPWPNALLGTDRLALPVASAGFRRLVPGAPRERIDDPLARTCVLRI